MAYTDKQPSLPEAIFRLRTILVDIGRVPGKGFEWRIVDSPEINQEVHQLPGWRQHPG